MCLPPHWQKDQDFKVIFGAIGSPTYVRVQDQTKQKTDPQPTEHYQQTVTYKGKRKDEDGLHQPSSLATLMDRGERGRERRKTSTREMNQRLATATGTGLLQ